MLPDTDGRPASAARTMELLNSTFDENLQAIARESLLLEQPAN